ncbi:MAG: hypothetical protein LBR09_02350 [Endomicrobium sp.]|jgi:thiamine-phosphate pyrophosphorylase|nr:hypothetical protein [Endomicrobium sp.]
MNSIHLSNITKGFNREASTKHSKLKRNTDIQQAFQKENTVFKHVSVLRIIDANLNRCREGLRVIEDSIRFILNDGVLYKKVRKIRHSVDKVLRDRYGELIKKRDSFDDSGRKMPEMSKRDLPELMIANFKRAQESLRVLEEYSKTFIPMASADFKRQRYTVYNLEKEVYLKYKIFYLK